MGLSGPQKRGEACDRKQAGSSEHRPQGERPGTPMAVAETSPLPSSHRGHFTWVVQSEDLGRSPASLPWRGLTTMTWCRARSSPFCFWNAERLCPREAPRRCSPGRLTRALRPRALVWSGGLQGVCRTRARGPRREPGGAGGGGPLPPLATSGGARPQREPAGAHPAPWGRGGAAGGHMDVGTEGPASTCFQDCWWRV